MVYYIIAILLAAVSVPLWLYGNDGPPKALLAAAVLLAIAVLLLAIGGEALSSIFPEILATLQIYGIIILFLCSMGLRNFRKERINESAATAVQPDTKA